MLACWRLGAVVLPGNEMLRAKDLRLRLETTRRRFLDRRNEFLHQLHSAGTLLHVHYLHRRCARTC